MVDPEAVRRRMRQIDARVRALEDVRARGEDAFLADPGVQAMVERHLQVAIQAAIDIAIHIVAEDSAQTPEDYAAAFAALAKIEIIDPALAGRLGDAARLRNVIVHMYLDVEPARVWAHLARLSVLRDLASAVETYLG